MQTFIFFVFCLYFLLMVFLLVGWRATRVLTDIVPCTFITVIVPCRNEEASVLKLIDDLIGLKYPPGLFEVVIVNDHSLDRTVDMVSKAISNQTNLKLLSLPEGQEGKKNAITFGVAHAKGEILVTTDADCRVPEKWLHLINELFRSGQCKMAIGAVRISEDNASPFADIQALEFGSLIGVSGATANLGFPTMCNGANLSFLKSAFLAVGGYDGNLQVASGDDEFLMRKIQSRFPGGVKFLQDPESVVTTMPQENFQSFVRQRLRWAGKWRYNTSLTSVMLAIFVVVFQLSFLWLMILALSGNIDPLTARGLIGIKIVLEFIYLFRVSRFLRQPLKPHYFLALQFVYPLYVVFIGVASFFVTTVWKGRRI